MWTKIANFILRFRIPLVVLLLVITGGMWYLGKEVKITTKFAELVPKGEPDQVAFESFRNNFGQDANAMVVGFQDSTIYTSPKVFNDFLAVCDSISNVEGVLQIVAIPELHQLEANKRRRFFTSKKIFEGPVSSKEELEQKLKIVGNVKLYEGQIYNPNDGATIIYVPIEQRYVDSTSREAVVQKIVSLVESFGKENGIDTHFAGLPYLRTNKTITTKKELSLFLALSVFVTAVVLYVFFRSFVTVIFPLVVIAMVVIWSKGTIGALGYELTSLTGLIPTILVVIGIPNAVYLINKYHQDFAQQGDKMQALTNVIRKIGVVTLITNFTTAIGFLVLTSADITILKEFGLVAGINVFSTFLISIILIPVLFSFLPPPSTRQLKHLDFRLVNGFLSQLNSLVQHHTRKVYWGAFAVVIVASYGVWKVGAVSFMTDDMAENDPAKISLVFFEEHFSGTMPLEIVVNTGDKNWFREEENLYRINEFEKLLAANEYLSRPVSLVQLSKGLRQAYYNGLPEYYDIPTSSEIKPIGEFLKRTQKREEKKGKSISSFGSFEDKSNTGQVRISVKCADVGSKELSHLINEVIYPQAHEIFDEVTINGEKLKYPVEVTGTSYLFLQGNTYLIKNLQESLLLAVALIAVIMAFLFRSFRMIVLSLIPNVIPLVVTGAIMGYFGIALKPSTALIFSIAFGISVDDSIHFLAKYRQELYITGFDVKKSVALAIKETGASMMYTSIILFFGFIIFTFSVSTSIQMLGLLTSTTLLMAMITNLIVLPSLLVTFDSVSTKKLKKD